MTIGIEDNKPNKPNQPKQPEQPKQPNQFKQFGIETVKEDLIQQIQLIQAGKKFKTVASLASEYLLTAKTFRNSCFNNKELSNLFSIYNGVFMEKTMMDAIKDGKINSQTEEFLRNEMQAYTNSGTEQNIYIVETDGSKEILMYDNDRKAFDTLVEIEPDVDIVNEEKITTIFDELGDE